MSDKEEFDQTINSLEASEDLGETVEAPISDVEPDNSIEKPKKARKKRELSQKQKDALKRGREKRMEKLKAKKENTGGSKGGYPLEEPKGKARYNLRKRVSKKKAKPKKTKVIYESESESSESEPEQQIIIKRKRKNRRRKKKAKKKPEVVYMTESSSDEESSDDGQIQRSKPIQMVQEQPVVQRESETVRKNRRHGHFYLDDD